jgi:hypothetical protein
MNINFLQKSLLVPFIGIVAFALLIKASIEDGDDYLPDDPTLQALAVIIQGASLGLLLAQIF